MVLGGGGRLPTRPVGPMAWLVQARTLSLSVCLCPSPQTHTQCTYLGYVGTSGGQADIHGEVMQAGPVWQASQVTWRHLEAETDIRVRATICAHMCMRMPTSCSAGRRNTEYHTYLGIFDGGFFFGQVYDRCVCKNPIEHQPVERG